MLKKNNYTDFFKQIPNNIFSGFVVSLVAMPLCLGLALASGAPPMAGIISGVVGGVIVSILGGSHVSITGPGNGLVVAVLGAITVLGGGDMYQGYLAALAAIICSGAVILVLAFANLGKLSNFFPSSAIQGLLAAIGIIILSKQFHIMVGDMDAQGSTIQLLMSIPKAVVEGLTNTYTAPAAIAGLLSLAIMVFYARIRNKYFQLIPAPMWIVVLSVGTAYIFEHTPNMAHPIPEAFFVKIPTNVFSNFPTPDFSKVFTGDFIMAVFTITMIASIESLLSIKAIDKLDPQRRRSNVDRDLKALGLATMVSGFLGGLNVVTVIARSSVNVNNGGTNRSSNFFQSLFLVLFILLFTKQLQHIPFPALAAILVFTGYKLASPSIIQKTSEIGKEQVVIFLVTMIVTLFTSIVMGIVVGILITFIIHIYLTKSFKLFFNNIRNSNIEMVETDGKIHITVKHFSSFINFFRLKNTLDAIDTKKSVVVDFLQSRFIDHTIMENMHDYAQVFDKNGGSFELKGLELHKAESDHPSALRRVLEYVHLVPDEHKITQRQKLIAQYFTDIGWHFDYRAQYQLYFLRSFNYFRTRQVDHIYNIGWDDTDIFKFFDIEYSEGAFILEEELHASMVYFKCNSDIPKFILSKEDLYDKLHYLSSYKEMHLPMFKDFEERFSLRGNNAAAIQHFFTDDLILFFESNRYYHIESNGEGILIMNKERQSDVGEIKAMVDYAIRLEAVIRQKM